MRYYSIADLHNQVLELQNMLETEQDEDKQLDIEREIEVLQNEIKLRKNSDKEMEQ